MVKNFRVLLLRFLKEFGTSAFCWTSSLQRANFMKVT